MQRVKESLPFTSECHLSAKAGADLLPQIPRHNLALGQDRVKDTAVVPTLQDTNQRARASSQGTGTAQVSSILFDHRGEGRHVLPTTAIGDVFLFFASILVVVVETLVVLQDWAPRVP
jgi:hypothetical protein